MVLGSTRGRENIIRALLEFSPELDTGDGGEEGEGGGGGEMETNFGSQSYVRRRKVPAAKNRSFKIARIVVM